MTEQTKINSVMTNKQRRSIVKKCKVQQGWYDFESGAREVNQDKFIEAECVALGYTLSNFYNCEGKTLEKLLS